MNKHSRPRKKNLYRIRLIVLLALTITTFSWTVTNVPEHFNIPIIIAQANQNSLDRIDEALNNFKNSQEEFIQQLTNAAKDKNIRKTLDSNKIYNKIAALNIAIDNFEAQSLSRYDNNKQAEISKLLTDIKRNNTEVLDKIFKPLQPGLGCNNQGINCQNIRKIQQHFFSSDSQDIDGILGSRTISKVDEFLSTQINDSERIVKQLESVKQETNSVSNLQQIIFLMFILLIVMLVYICILSVKLKSIKYELDKKIRNFSQANEHNYKASLKDSFKIKKEYDKKLNELQDKLKLLEQYLKTKNNLVTSEAIKINGALELPQTIKINAPTSKLVEIYNDCPQVLSSSIVTVSVTADSYRQKTQGQIFLERVGHGNYWVVATKDGQYWLFPNSNISINIHKLKTIRFMFDCLGDYSSNDGDFILNQPAKVAILPSGQKWKLEKKGRLVFNNDSRSSQSRSHLKRVNQKNESLVN